MTTSLEEALDQVVGPSLATPPAPAPPAARPQLVDARVADLIPDPDNPREDVGDVTELANSMAANGLLQPIVARRHTGDTGRTRLIVVAGHRRLAAAQLLRWATVPTIIRADMRPDAVLAAMLVENGQRAGLDPIEEARALSRLQCEGGRNLSHAELAHRIGRTQVHVSGRLSLLALSPEDQDLLRAGEMNLGDAVRKARVLAGRVRAGSTGHPHLGSEHDLASRVRARCRRLNHKRGGRNSVGGVACGECWETVIRADERERLNTQSNQRGRCVLCDTDHDPDRAA